MEFIFRHEPNSADEEVFEPEYQRLLVKVALPYYDIFIAVLGNFHCRNPL